MTPSSSGLRILTLCYEFPPLGGGGARVAHGLARQLVAAGHSVHLLTLGMAGLPAVEQVEGIVIQRVCGWRRRSDRANPLELASYLLAVRGPLKRLLMQQQFDVAHVHFLMPDGVLALLVPLLRGLPLVITAHGSDVPGFNPDRFLLLHRMLMPVWLRVTRAAEIIVCPSRFLASLLLRYNPGAPVTIVPNGLDLKRLRADQGRTPRLLAVSRLFHRKGVQDLLDALGSGGMTLQTVVVGTGPHEKPLRAQAQRLGIAARVEFTGWLDNDSSRLRDLYETSSLFVFTSHAENFPVVLLEAMAAGLAIIAADIPSTREVLGEAAVFYPVGDAVALRAALDALVCDPARREALGREANARLQQHFGWPAVAAQYVAVYRAAMSAAALKTR